MSKTNNRLYFFDINQLSWFRSALMGVAIIWVFILHSGEIGVPFYDSIRQWGWMGVDIFFFLSAYGMGFSLKKDKDNFMNRRFKRIIPTWIVVLFLVHIVGVLSVHYHPGASFSFPTSVFQILSWYTGLGYWIANIFDFQDKLSWYYEWYIPTLLLFYLFTPFLYNRTKIQIVVLIFILIFLGQITILLFGLPFLALSITRAPIYLLGILFYKFLDNSQRTPKCDTFINIGCLLLGIMLFFLPLEFLRKEYRILFFIPPLLILLSNIIQRLQLTTLLSFFGGISLELYLIHLYGRPNYLMGYLFERQAYVIFFSLLFCTLCAYVLHNAIKVAEKKIKTTLKKP